MYYRCQHFRIEELVSPEFHKKWGQKAWWFIDHGLCQTIDTIREAIGMSITINDWLWGGEFDASGLRQEGDEYYSPTSAHSFGRAVDMKCSGMSSRRLRSIILNMKKEGLLPYLTRIEMGTNGWVHIDTFNAEPNSIKENIYKFWP